MRNRVFRCIEDRARGFVGILLGEMVVGFGLLAVGIFVGHPLIGLGTSGVVMAALAGWRKRDHDRVDYVRSAWRRLYARSRVYSPANRANRQRTGGPYWATDGPVTGWQWRRCLFH